MAGSILFATSFIAANENKILSYDKLMRMLDSGNVPDALKVLYEVPYAEGQTISSVYEYEKLLSLEEKKLYSFIKSICPSDSLMSFLMLKNDYHNLKVILKSKYGKVRLDEETLYSTTVIDKDSLLSYIQNEMYAFLPENMRHAILKLDSDYISSKLTPQEIDLILDKAYIQTCLELQKSVKSKALSIYLNAQIDFANLLCVARLKKLNEDRNLEDYYINGGSYSYDNFVAFCDMTNDAFYEYFKYSDYRIFVNDLIEDNFLSYEKNTQNYLLNIFKSRKTNNFTIDPILGYYFAKQSEIKNVRIILTGLISHIDENIIKERLRDCYV